MKSNRSAGSAVSKSHSHLQSKQPIQGRRPSEFNRRAPRRQQRVSQSEDNLQLKKLKRQETGSDRSEYSSVGGTDVSYLALQAHAKYNQKKLSPGGGLNLPPIEEHGAKKRGPRALNRKRIMAAPSPGYFRC